MNFTFELVDAKTEVVELLKTSLPKFGFQEVRVIKADPQSSAEIPCIGVNRVDDSESTDTIADAVGTHYDPETETNYRTFGSYFQESLEIRAWHTNADERNRLYQTMKAILFAGRQDLTAKGVLNIKLRNGRDEQDSSMAQAPMVLYWASITMSYLNPLDVQFEEASYTISSIVGNMKATKGGTGE